jgi:HSP20 family protein
MRQPAENGQSTRALPPPRLAADVYESPDGAEYIVEIPVPGLSSNEITIEATADGLTVTTRPAETEEQSNRRYLQQEQEQGPASRVIEFPVEIDVDHIEASLEAGMLKIRVRKAEASPRRVIKLQTQA